jgi:hypothetical protein
MAVAQHWPAFGPSGALVLRGADPRLPQRIRGMSGRDSIEITVPGLREASAIRSARFEVGAATGSPAGGADRENAPLRSRANDRRLRRSVKRISR